MTSPNETILDIQDLKLYFPVTKGLLRRKVAEVKAIDGISFTVKKGETLGLVGESGCGKTTTGRCISRLYRPTAGKIRFEGKDIATDYSGSRTKLLRRQVSLIFQDPFGSLDPRHSAGRIVGEPLRVHNLTKTRAEYNSRIRELFQMVGLDPSMKDRFPHEFSGGQRQRIGIARALAGRPSLIVCDEPVSALDVSIQAQIINLLKDLQDEIEGLTYVFISHDLSVVRHISDQVAVMYLGRIVEIGKPDDLYGDPRHPYTEALLSAVPIPNPVAELGRKRIILRGEAPSPLNPPGGCAFHPRCPMATEECSQGVPPLRDVGREHLVACIKA